MVNRYVDAVMEVMETILSHSHRSGGGSGSHRKNRVKSNDDDNNVDDIDSKAFDSTQICDKSLSNHRRYKHYWR